MKRALSFSMLALMVFGSLGLSGSAWADNDRAPGWMQHGNYHARQNHFRHNNFRYDPRQMDSLKTQMNRQLALVNSLQARVDDLRRHNRTRTGEYDATLRQLRIAQADYQQIRNQLSYNY